MHEDYRDIRDKIGEPPTWWDEHAVPRYCEFHPDRLANIYADEAALVLIACQSCGQKFRVAFSQNRTDDRIHDIRHGSTTPSLADSIKSKAIHYGDPPNTGCCPAGATMNCDDIVVLQYWARRNQEWERDSALEIDVSNV